jgi:hypothetical protein
LERDDGALADHLLDEAERHLGYAEHTVIVEQRKRADPASYQELRARIRALVSTPVLGIVGGIPYLGKTKEIEAAIEALEDEADFAAARRWCEVAERTLPEAIRALCRDNDRDQFIVAHVLAAAWLAWPSNSPVSGPSN